MADGRPLRSLDAWQHEIATCVFCPKLCRFACPVAEAETRETVTPWGLMTRLDDARRGAAPLDVVSAELWTHCTGCRRCQAVCKYDNPVATVMYAARAATQTLDLAPEALGAWAEAPQPLRPSVEALPTEGAVRLLPGRAPEETVRAALSLLSAAGCDAVGRPAGPHLESSHRLREAGLLEDAARHDDALGRGLLGARTVVCLDPADAVALRALGGASMEVAHLVELLDRRLPTLRPAHRGDVLYLDNCRLGRGLGVYDAPRALLAQVVDGEIHEAVMNREMGGCCGAGAGYVATSPEDARVTAREHAGDVPDVPVVTVGAPCVAHLGGALAGRQVIDWIRLVAAGLPEREGSET